MTTPDQHHIRANEIFNRAKGELDVDITGIVEELDQASSRLKVIASVLPGPNPLQAEQRLVDAALNRAKTLTEKVDAVLHVHVDLAKRGGRIES